MSDKAKETGKPHARRVELLVRDRALVQATAPTNGSRALTTYLAKCGDDLELADAVWTNGGEVLDTLSLRRNEILWVRCLEPDFPTIDAKASKGATVPVEVELAEGHLLRGELPLEAGHTIRELLEADADFVTLRGASEPTAEEPLGDLALGRGAIRRVQDLRPEGAEPEWRALPAKASTVNAHWLVRMARQLDLTGAEALDLPASAPIAQAWRAVCAISGLTEDELAVQLAKKLRIDVGDPSQATKAGLKRVPDGLADRFGVRGMADDGRTVTVATADPMNADAEQALAFACERRVRFVLATPLSLGLESKSAPTPDADMEALLSGMNSAATAAVSIEEEEELEATEVGVEDATAEPIIKLANVILREAVRQNASDIHIEPDGSRGLIRFRVDGVLRPYMHVPLIALNRVISRYKVVARLDIADRIRPQDGRVRLRIDGQRYELRLSTVPTQDAEKAVIRIAGAVSEQTLDKIAIPELELDRIRELLGFRDGIIVVTGPTGSGKTTTLYGALHELNTGKVNIMTVEDPIERALSGITQIQVDPKRGVTFASALRAILRQDPDVILVGEIRDSETAQIAVQAAMTGHLVLTTLHTTSAVGVIERLHDLGLDRASLAASLRGIVAQRLARRVCDSCDTAGCPDCEEEGYRGRVPLMEVLTAGPEFTELVSHGALYHELQRSAEEQGMRPIREMAAARVAEGITTHEEVLRVLGDSDRDVSARAKGSAAPSAVDATKGETAAIASGSREGELPEGSAGLPARLSDVGADSTDRRRTTAARTLIQGLDRCLAEAQPIGEVLNYACSQLATAFDLPLVWIATLKDGALTMQARAGESAPYAHDLVPDWSLVEESDGAIATALSTGTPQACRIDEEPGFDSWREHARAHGLPIFLAVPMMAGDEAVGLVGLHAYGVEGLDRDVGREMVNLVDHIGGVVERLRGMEAVGMHLAALELAADSVFTTDRNGVIQWVNRSFTQLTGYSAAEAIGQTPRILRSDHHDEAFFKELWDTVLLGRPWRGELHNRRRDGSEYVVEQTITPVSDATGRITHFMSVQRDISERKQREESVRHLVSCDALTGLPNARALETELSASVGAVKGGREEATLLLIRVDGFNARSEEEGPAAADASIASVSGILADTLRPGDFLARLGDDEFAALLPGTGSAGAVITADRLRSAVASVEDAPSITIGMATVDGSQSPRAVLAKADAGLYGARDTRGDVPRIGAGPADAEASAEWAERIRDALRDDLFFLHFQPVVELRTGNVSHFDVLLRLHDDEGEVIPARAFISHAEVLGMMHQIDRWVVENALRLLQTSPDMRLSLNLSADTVTDSGFRQYVQRQSRRMNAVGGRIIFEVGEVASPQAMPHVLDHMNQLYELGCRFALDNFGFGRASLASLGTLPVDYVKLDGSLIRGIDVDESRHELVRSLVTVARALDCEVIAGGAERESIVQLLPALGIELAQGHHFGRPGPELRSGMQVAGVAVEDGAEGNADWRPRLAG